MDDALKCFLQREYQFSPKVLELVDRVEADIQPLLSKVDHIAMYNQAKMLKGFHDVGINESHFMGTTGYGYDDLGREALGEVYAKVFKAEDALVRAQIVSGTHAIASCLFGILRPGDEVVYLTGKPYDTFEEVIGIRGNQSGSLMEWGVRYNHLDLTPEGKVDIENIAKVIKPTTKMVVLQRSRGYAWRPSLTIDDIAEILNICYEISPDIVSLVDNCYGEFAEIQEPTEVGADLIAGSLIKNPSGGIAPMGGYVCGKKKYVDQVANWLTAPGLGREVGASANAHRLFYQGFFLAPEVAAGAMKGAILASGLYQTLGFDVLPAPDVKRGDIVQAIRFEDEDKLIAFCQGIQMGSPVGAIYLPIPADQPGYNDKIIMASGSFIQGSSIELSADGPLRPPYIAYLQGGLTYDYAKLGIAIATNHMYQKGLLDIE